MGVIVDGVWGKAPPLRVCPWEGRVGLVLRVDDLYVVYVEEGKEGEWGKRGRTVCVQVRVPTLDRTLAVRWAYAGSDRQLQRARLRRCGGKDRAVGAKGAK